MQHMYRMGKCFLALIQVLFFIIGMGTLQKGHTEATGLPACYMLPDCRVEGVNLLTGGYCHDIVDLATEGVDPIVLHRYNSSENPQNAWQYGIGKHLYLACDDAGKCMIYYPDGQGGLALFSSQVSAINKKKLYYCPPAAKFFYDTKTPLPRYPGTLSGQNCLDNVYLEITDNGTVITAYHGDGTTHRYVSLEKKGPFILPATYELQKETLPSGNQRLYWCLKEENHQHGRVKMETRSARGAFLNHLIIENLHLLDGGTGVTNENTRVNYKRDAIVSSPMNALGFHFLQSVIDPSGVSHRYTYDLKMRLSRKELPGDRVVSVSYTNEGNRVHELRNPLPNDLTHGKYGLSHRFFYPKRQDNKHDMQVCPFGRAIIRILAENGKLLEYTRHVRGFCIKPSECMPNNDFPYSVQKFFWGNRDKREDLLTIALFPNAGTSTAVGCRTFTYDANHNITEERLYGNLSGTCTHSPSVNDKGKVSANQSESTWTRHRYSSDGRNLLLSTEEASGKVTSYSYKNGTNLLAAELVGDGKTQIHRTFHTYNDQGVCIETVIDDGVNKDCGDLTGVTMRRVMRTQVRQDGIAIGVPYVEEDYYLNEKRKLTLLQRRVNDYDNKGRLVKKCVFDSDGTLAQTFSWDYNAVGLLVKMSDPSGTVRYAYDANGNRTEEHFVERDLSYNNTYDRLNNLIERREIHRNMQRTWRYSYNTHGQCVEEIDPFDQTTKHRYDDLGREIETTYPPSMSPQGTCVQANLHYAYNISDMKIESRYGKKGTPEKMAYNMRGQITEQTFLDGSIEKREYTLGGVLKKTISKLGLISEYDIDFMGRTTTKRDYDNQGQLLNAIHYEYKGLLLHSIIHENGPTISYRYDGAGRIIEQEHNQERELSYTYDSMGRIRTKTEWIDAASAKVTTYTYDSLDHVTSERVSDLQGHLLSEHGYTYDLQGNCTEVRQLLNQGVSITKTHYDAWNRIIETIDPEGHRTHYTYDTETNTFGQKVLKVTCCDAKGNLHITTHHANGQAAEQCDIDSFGTLLRRHKLFYNAMNQVVERHDAVYMDGTSIRDIVTKWTYDKAGHMTLLIEAVGTPEERQTHTLYTANGQPHRIKLPNEDVHTFAYNVKGEKIQHHDEQGTFSFLYSYDPMGNLVEAVDQVTDSHTKRVFDLRGRMKQEELGNGLTITYQHDLLGRATEVHLPDGSSVAYAHDPAYLRRVTRLDPEGNQRYEHNYMQIDLAGNTIESALPGHCGTLRNAYTKRGMIQSIQHQTWRQCIPQYDALGNMLSRTTCDPSGEYTEHYAYDALNQLIQEDGHTDHTYTYDSLYNRQIQDGVQGQFNHLNQLLQRGESIYRYDKNGQTISIEKGQERADYTYDGLGRLTSQQSDNHRTTYTYDPFHRRLSKTTWTLENDAWRELDTERFLYLDQNEVGSVDQEGKMITFRVLGRNIGAEIGANIALEIRTHVYIPIHDHNGSIAMLLDPADGTSVEYARYSAFGESQLFDTRDQPLQESAVRNPWGYSSKRIDLESGWIFFGRRYYNTQEGRWMTPDPLGFTDGQNLYAYVLNCPTTHCDLYGLTTSYTSPIRAVKEAAEYFRGEGHRFGCPMGFGPFNMLSRLFYAALPFVQIPGRMVEMIARHFLPLPGFRDVLMIFGRLLSLRPALGCEQCWEHDSYNFKIPGNGSSKVVVCITNGILTSKSELEQKAAQTFMAYGGKCDVYATYNKTQGFSLDVLRSAYMMLGGLPDACHKLAENWKTALKDKGEGCVILHKAHSQGGQDTWCARRLIDKKDWKKIDVTTFGSAHLIPEGVFKRARNYISTRDGVPLIASMHRYIQAKRGVKSESNTYFFPGKGLPGSDHPWNVAYAEQEQENILEDLKTYFSNE